MSDRASDTAETITAPPKARDRAPLEAADIIRLLQQAAAGTKANSQRAAGAEIEAGDRPDDALKLLQELARKSGGDDQARQAQVGQAAAPHAPAPQPGAPQPQALQPQALQPQPAPASYPTIAAMIAGLNQPEPSAETPPPTRGRNGRQIALFAVAGCLAMLAAGGAGYFLWNWIADQDSALQTETPATVAAPSESTAAPAVQARPNVPSVQTAMEECDVQAAKNPFTMYFLVSPVALGSDVRPAPTQSGEEDYGSYALMSSKAMLDGLRDQSLTLNAKPFRYAIIDSATGKTKTWSTATGVSKFTHDDTATFSKFRVRIDVGGKEAKWSSEYPRRVGECYWVNVRLR